MDATAFAALALLAFALPISIAGANFALGLLNLALLLRWWKAAAPAGPAPWWKRPAVRSLALYAAAGVLVSLFGLDLANSARDWHKDLASALLLTALPARSGEERRRLARLLALGLCASAAIGVGQTVWHLARG